MEFLVLGPFQARDGDRVLELPRQKHRALLACLALRAGEVVSMDRLVEDLWGDRAPANARASLQNFVSQLRRTVGSNVLLTRPPGYVLDIEPESVDLFRFERLLEEARRLEGHERADRLRSALSLWRGPPIADLMFEPFAGVEAERLEARGASAREDLIDAELELGLHAELVPRIEAIVAVNPLGERPHAQLMLALYRCGRQADSVTVVYGNGAPVSFSGNLFNSGGITLIDTPAQGAIYENAPDPRSVVVITFDAMLNPTVKPGCFTNTATLLQYASVDGQGPSNNFVTTPHPTDDAYVCVKPRATKLIAGTSERHTVETTADTPTDARPAVIGEIVRYKLRVQIPEAGGSVYKVTDDLPASLGYLADGTARASIVAPGSLTAPALTGCTPNGPPCSISALAGSFGCANPGADPTFNLGTVTNANISTAPEYIDIELNAEVCNQGTSVRNTPISNGFTVATTAPSGATTSASSASSWADSKASVKVVEPTISVQKTGITFVADPSSDHPTPWAEWTVRIQNVSTIDAFDVDLTDALVNTGAVSGSTFVSVQITGGLAADRALCQISGMDLSCSALAAGHQLVLTYDVDVPSPATDASGCGLPVGNNATVRWTSLPGLGTAIGGLGNTTGSQTPGGSGAQDGERNGLGSVNTYVATSGDRLAPPPVPLPSGCFGWEPLQRPAS